MSQYPQHESSTFNKTLCVLSAIGLWLIAGYAAAQSRGAPELDDLSNPKMIPGPLSQFVDPASPPDPTPQADATTNLSVELRMISFEPSMVDQIYEVIPKQSLQMSDADLPILSPSSARPVSPAHAKIDWAKSNEMVMQSAPTTLAPLTPDELEKIFQKVKGEPRTNVTQSPTVTFKAKQPATISDTSWRPFLVGVKKQSRPDGTQKFVPVIQTVAEGIIVRVTGENQEKKIRIQADLILSEIDRVDTVQAFGPFGEKVQIQMPRHRVQQTQISAAVKAGQSLLVDPCFVRRVDSRVEEVANIPYLKHLASIQPFLKRTKIEKVDQRVLFILTPRRAAPEPTQRLGQR